MIRPGRAFTIGLESIWKNKQIWLFFYSLNFFLAFGVTLPLRVMVLKYFRQSLSMEKFLLHFDYMALTNFLRDNSSGLSVLFVVFLLGVLSFILLRYFFAGGAFYAYLNPEEKHSFPSFFEKSAFYAGAMLRLFLFSLIFVLLTIFIYMLLLKGLAGVKPHIPNEMASSMLRASVLGVTGILFLAFKMIIDYARAVIVLSGRRSALAALAEAIRFFGKHFFSTIELFYLIFLTGLLIFLMNLLFGHHVFDWVNHIPLLVFLLQQSFVILQTAVLLLFWSAQGLFLKRAKMETEF